jgi:sialidase-1
MTEIREMVREPKPLMTPVFESTVCPWTPENPRHDHQLIFPLDEERLMLVWSEYYADSPRLVERNQFKGDNSGFADQAPCRISAKISRDVGRSWSSKFTLQENRWGLNVKHPNLIRLIDGGVLFTFSAWESESAGRNIFMKKSSDNCETWDRFVQISEPGWYCTNNDHALRLSSGRILIPSHGGPAFVYEGGKSKLHSFVFYSDDEGESWNMSDNFTAPGRGAHEPTILELEGGRLVCLMRTTNACIYRNYSDDWGVHWSEPKPIPLEAPDSPPLMKYIPGTSDMLLLWNNVASHSNWPRTPLTAAISSDGGTTWGKLKDIDNRIDHDAAYAGLTFHGDEALITYYTRGTYWTRDTEIMLKVFKIDQFYE